jgi:8-oxo-dGTP pyrophosphatase MutT (NUDIX family)
MASARVALEKVAADALPLRPRVSMIVHDGKGGVLVGRGRSGGYVLPGGGIDPGESVTEAGHRETLEEAGWHVTDLHDTGHRSEIAWSQAYLDSLPEDSRRRQFGGSLTHFVVGRAERPDTRLLGSEGDALHAPGFVPLTKVLREAEKSHQRSLAQNGPDSEIHQQYYGKLVPALRYAQQRLATGAKTSSATDLLPDFLARPARDGYIDPRSDDFAKNQAFGRALGAGGIPAIAGASLALAGRPAIGVPLALAGAAVGKVVHDRTLGQMRELQAQGRNPVTRKAHDHAQIERTISWAKKRHRDR